MVEFISMPGRRYEIYAARIGTLAQRGEIFDATILKIKIFDLFQILVFKPLLFRIITVKSSGLIKFDGLMGG